MLTKNAPQLKSSYPTYLLRETSVINNHNNDYVLCVKDLPENEKPREKLLQSGAKNLTLAELLAIILGSGTKKEEILTMTNRIVREYGEKALQHELDPKKLSNALSLPLNKSMQIVSAFELGRRFFAQKGGKPVFIRNSSQAFEHIKDMGSAHKEQLRGLYLNSRHELIHDEVISVGSVTANIVHPREVYQPAILHNAVAIIIAHNHPSGDPEPTPPDLAVTEQLRRAGDSLGISLLDHLIVAGSKYHSLLLKEHLL